MSRAKLKYKPSKLARRRKKRFISRLIIYCIFFISLIPGFYFLSSADFISINKIQVSGTETLNEKEIEAFLGQKISGRYLKIFSKSNIFFYPKKEITKELPERYKKILKTEVGIEDFDSLLVKIEERRPFGLWCRKIEKQTDDFEEERIGEDLPNPNLFKEECFYLDKTGFIFAPVDDIENGDYVKYFGKDIENPVGDFFIDPKDFLKIQDFFNFLKIFKVKPIELVVENSSAEVLLDSNTKIFWDTNILPENAFEDLSALLGEPEFQKSDQPIYFFEQIDLRFRPKILYRLNH